MKKIPFLLSIVFFAQFSFAQNYYLISFTDKGPEAEHLLSSPALFLSPKAIEKKLREGIQISEEDLPLSFSYLNALKKSQASIEVGSKWFNAVIIKSTKNIEYFKKYSFIKSVEIFDGNEVIPTSVNQAQAASKIALTPDYGFADQQIRMINLHCVHDRGAWGEGILMAIFEAA